MAETFWADCSIFADYNKDTATYVEKQWGVKLRVEEADEDPQSILNGLGITVRDYPEIMTEIQQSGYFQPQSVLWQVNRISPDGITLYLVNHGGKSDDGRHDVWEEVFIFIPMSNVIAIHNVSQQFFINESLRSIEREGKHSRES
jgi:hypothetical protein